MAEPVLYSFRRCPYAMRARLALKISGLRCELREVKLAAKPQALLDASPKGTVPVLVLAGGQVVDESLDIMRLALSQCDPEGWLERDDPALIAANDGPFKRALDRYKYPHRYDADPLPHRSAGLDMLRQIDDRLGAAGQLCGARRGIADMAVMPFIRQFAMTDPAWFTHQDLPHLQTWLEAHLQSELFGAVMVRHPVWQEDSAPVSFGAPSPPRG